MQMMKIIDPLKRCYILTAAILLLGHSLFFRYSNGKA